MEALLNDPPHQDITHKSNEAPLEFLTRHGYEIQCLADCFTARLYKKIPQEKPPLGAWPPTWKEQQAAKRRQTGPSAGRICLEDWMARTARELAILVGWYQ